MKKILKIFIILFVVGISFLFAKNSLALVEVFEQSILDTKSNEVSNIFNNPTQIFQEHEGQVTSSTDPVWGVFLAFETEKNCNIYAKLNFIFNSSEGSCVSPWTVTSENTVSTTANDYGLWGFTFDTNHACNMIDGLSSIQIVSDNCTASADNDGWIYGSNSSSSWPYGKAGNSDSYFDPVKDVYFRLYTGETELPESSVELNPIIADVQCDFDNWKVDYFLNESDYTIFENNSWGGTVFGVTVNYGIDPDSLLYSSTAGITVEENFSMGSTILPKPQPLMAGYIWYYQTCFCEEIDNVDCSSLSNLFYCSEVQQFIIDPECSVDPFGQRNLWQGESASTTLSTQSFYNEAFCEENYEGTLTQGFCKLFYSLFVPNGESLQRFSSLKNKLEKKPPFGYLAIYSETMENFESATSTTSTISTSFVNNLSTVKEISLYQNFYDIMIWVLWLIFGFYVYHRFRHFSLVG